MRNLVVWFLLVTAVVIADGVKHKDYLSPYAGFSYFTPLTAQVQKPYPDVKLNYIKYSQYSDDNYPVPPSYIQQIWDQGPKSAGLSNLFGPQTWSNSYVPKRIYPKKFQRAEKLL